GDRRGHAPDEGGVVVVLPGARELRVELADLEAMREGPGLRLDPSGVVLDAVLETLAGGLAPAVAARDRGFPRLALQERIAQDGHPVVALLLEDHPVVLLVLVALGPDLLGAGVEGRGDRAAGAAGDPDLVFQPHVAAAAGAVAVDPDLARADREVVRAGHHAGLGAGVPWLLAGKLPRRRLEVPARLQAALHRGVKLARAH